MSARKEAQMSSHNHRTGPVRTGWSLTRWVVIAAVTVVAAAVVALLVLYGGGGSGTGGY